MADEHPPVSPPLPSQPEPPPPHVVRATWDDVPRGQAVEPETAGRIGSRPWVHLLLFVLTFVTTTLGGASFYDNYLTAVGTRNLPADMTRPDMLLGGLWFSVPVLLILGCHEMGHYLACRYYRIPATLPYFIPVPWFMGTFGAVIRMAVPRTKRALFDVGIAGPIAGFVIAVPVAIVGVGLSYVAGIPATYRPQGVITILGDPLLLSWLQRMWHGQVAAGSVFVTHPMAFAAWLGMLATALNLIPVGHLDGGHIAYAVLGRRSRYISIVALFGVIALALTVVSSWVIWAILLTAMLVLLGVDHPPVEDEHAPIDNIRKGLALFAILMFVVCFIYVPISYSGRLR